MGRLSGAAPRSNSGRASGCVFPPSLTSFWTSTGWVTRAGTWIDWAAAPTAKRRERSRRRITPDAARGAAPPVAPHAAAGVARARLSHDCRTLISFLQSQAAPALEIDAPSVSRRTPQPRHPGRSVGGQVYIRQGSTSATLLKTINPAESLCWASGGQSDTLEIPDAGLKRKACASHAFQAHNQSR